MNIRLLPTPAATIGTLCCSNCLQFNIHIRLFFVNALSQWETTLLCNVVSQWLSACTTFSRHIILIMQSTLIPSFPVIDTTTHPGTCNGHHTCRGVICKRTHTKTKTLPGYSSIWYHEIHFCRHMTKFCSTELHIPSSKCDSLRLNVSIIYLLQHSCTIVSSSFQTSNLSLLLSANIIHILPGTFRLYTFNSTSEVKGHYNDVIMSAMASQITSLTIVYSTVFSGADQRKHQSSASLAFVRGIHRWPLNSPHKGPATRKMFPFDDAIMWYISYRRWNILRVLAF